MTDRPRLSEPSCASFELPPLVGITDRKKAAINRLKRLRARAWMRSQGIHQLGREAFQ